MVAHGPELPPFNAVARVKGLPSARATPRPEQARAAPSRSSEAGQLARGDQHVGQHPRSGGRLRRVSPSIEEVAGTVQVPGEHGRVPGERHGLRPQRGVLDPAREGDRHPASARMPRCHRSRTAAPGDREGTAPRRVGGPGIDPVEPGQPLACMPAQGEVEPQAAGHLRSVRDPVALEQPQVRRPEVGVVGLQPVELAGQVRPAQLGWPSSARARGSARVPVGVGLAV